MTTCGAEWGIVRKFSATALGLVLAACGGRAELDPNASIKAEAANPATPVDSTMPASAAPEPDPESLKTKPLFTTPIVLDADSDAKGRATIRIPKGALGFNAVAAWDRDDSTGIRAVSSPQNVTVHSDFTPVSGSGQTSMSYFGGIAAVAVPQNDMPEATTLAEGDWTLFLAPYSSHVRTYVQVTDDGQFHGGELDLHIHIPKGLTVSDEAGNRVKLDANTGLTNTYVAKRVDVFFAALEQHFGIGRGSVTFHEAPANLSSLDDMNSVMTATAFSGGESDGQALHMLFTGPLGDGVWAFSPGAPGAVARRNTPMSTVVVGLWGAPADADALATLHEVGHFIGLSHTSELDGFGHDALSDTPVCSGISKDNLDVCPDVNNLMFPVGFLEQASVSPSQKRVVQGSPMYRAFASPQAKPAFGLQRPTQATASTAISTRWLTGHDGAMTKIERNLASTFCAHGPGRNQKARFKSTAAINALKAIADNSSASPILRARANAVLMGASGN